MPLQDQLEIIRSNGQVEFFTPDPHKGVTNIGAHPENDVVLDGPGVAPFHAVLDHRQKPFQLVVLSHDGATVLRNQTVAPNVPLPIRHRDAIRINGNTVILIEGDLSLPATALAAVPEFLPATLPEMAAALPAGIVPPTSRPERFGMGEVFAAIPPDSTSEAIILEMGDDRERTVDVSQAGAYQLTIVNGGNIVATFLVSVAGIDPGWVMVSPPQVNLYEGERTTVTINIMPPRHPNSSAGPHPFAIVVTSPNYPQQSSRRGAVLNVNPYYEFSVDELTPKRQSISWFKRFGQTNLSITNSGNSETFFRVEGEDDERACSFEFTIPGEAVGLARQADLEIEANETVSIPISITPYSRRLIGLRKRTYNFTVTSTPLAEQQTPRSLLGDLRSAPLIGPLLILLILFLLVAAVIYTFTPGIVRFDAQPGAITAGQDVELFWRALPPFFIDVRLDGEPVDASGRLLVEELHQSKTYRLTADTWLSKMFRLLTAGEDQFVAVAPVRPEISLFEVQPEEIGSGEPVVLSWFTIGADELTLINNNLGVENELDQPAGSIVLIPDSDLVLTLRAVNKSAPEDPVQKLARVRVTTPTPEPIPQPVIDQFIVAPTVISAGQTVLLQWAVRGADSVTVQPLGSGLPPVSPPISHQPQETTLYVLSASNGEDTVNAVQQVIVGEEPTPTPTATPAALPVIDLLQVTPPEQVRADSDDRGAKENEITVQINWVVTGDVTNVELTGGPPGFEKLSNLARIGEVQFFIRDTTVFVLTAYNGHEQASETTQIQFMDATPTPEPSATDPADGSGGGGSASGTPTPTPEIEFFEAQGVSASDQVTQVGSGTYQVVAGSNVNLLWSTQNADTVTLVGVGDQPPAGSYTLSNVISAQVFQLTATGDGGTAQESLQLTIAPIPVPPSPYNISGSESGSQITLSWLHDAENSIIGFRVYRAPAVSGPFTRIADESQLSNSTRQYIDSGPLPACAAYYLTAVYVDPVSGNRIETAAGSNGWLSSGCP